MQKTDGTIILSELFLLGKGHHKAAYWYPGKPDLCIKIPYETPDYDLERELAYRRVRKKRNLPSSLLTEYYGTVATNLGTGYVFERMTDYNGNPSISLTDFLGSCNGNPEKEHFISQMLKKLYKDELEEEIITSDTNPDNFYLQETAPGEFRLRIIDNIGSHAHIPLLYYVSFLARQHVTKYWKRFLREIKRKFPDVNLEQLTF